MLTPQFVGATITSKSANVTLNIIILCIDWCSFNGKFSKGMHKPHICKSIIHKYNWTPHSGAHSWSTAVTQGTLLFII